MRSASLVTAVIKANYRVIATMHIKHGNETHANLRLILNKIKQDATESYAIHKSKAE